MDNAKSEKKTNKFYVVNLDINRIFWLVAISLFIINISFLIGYWLGNKVDYNNVQNSNGWTGVENLDKEEIKHFSNITEIKDITKEALNSIKNKKDTETKNNLDTNAKTQLDTNKDNDERKSSAKNTIKSGKKEKEKKETQKEITRTIAKNKSNLTAKQNLSKRYSVQIASYKVKNNAFLSKKALHNKGKKSYLVVKNSNGGKIYLLRLGPFPSYNKAKKEKEKLKHSFKDSFIIKTN